MTGRLSLLGVHGVRPSVERHSLGAEGLFMFHRNVATLVLAAICAAPGFVQGAFAQSGPQSGSLAQPCSEAVVSAAPVGYVEPCASKALSQRHQPGMSWEKPILASLEAATVATQLLEAHATLRAMDANVLEVNGMMSGVLKNRIAFLGVKAALGVGVAYATHRIARRSKVGGIVTAVAVNSAYLYIAHRNYSLARSVQ